ncbi:MAG: esterase-like activity of phytase family protein [Tepidisphaeraceae bacterium]
MRSAALLLVLLTTSLTDGATLTFRDSKLLEGNEVRGLSGITRAGDLLYYAVNDHPPAAISIAIQTRGDGSLERIKVVKSFPLPGLRDAEGIAALPKTQLMFVVDESTSDLRAYEFPLTQRRSRPLPMPEIFKTIVPNQGLESLTVSPDGKTFWTANERALAIDGNPQTPATPIFSATRVRLQRYALADDGAAAAKEQFEYQTSGVHDWGGTIGLCDLAVLPDGRLLALERSAARNFSGVSSIRTRIFLVDTSSATDISKPPYDKGLVDQPHPPAKVKKTLLWDDFVHDENGENVEGICLGPELGEGRWAVIGVVDSGDGGLGLSRPALISFELDLNAPPAATTQATAPTTPMPAATTRPALRHNAAEGGAVPTKPR